MTGAAGIERVIINASRMKIAGRFEDHLGTTYAVFVCRVRVLRDGKAVQRVEDFGQFNVARLEVAKGGGGCVRPWHRVKDAACGAGNERVLDVHRRLSLACLLGMTLE